MSDYLFAELLTRGWWCVGARGC